MDLKKYLDKLILTFKKSIFTYKDGYYNLAYLANSPEVMVKSFEKMPFVKKNGENTLITQNIFCKGQLMYQKLEEGLWLILSDMYHKKNVSYRLLYDNYLPKDYYLLALNYASNKINSYYYHSNETIDLGNEHWSFAKPGQDALEFIRKNSTTKHILIYMSEEWIKRNLYSDKVFVASKLDLFMNSQNKHIIQSENRMLTESWMLKLQLLLHERDAFNNVNILDLKTKVLKIINTFMQLQTDFPEKIHASTLKPEDHLLICNVEKYLLEHLFNKFIGIDHLAEKFGISPTKLKSNFKQVFGQSIFQYFREQQLLASKNILDKRKVPVKEIANLFGYDNPAKFSIAFKNKFGKSPAF